MARLKKNTSFSSSSTKRTFRVIGVVNGFAPGVKSYRSPLRLATDGHDFSPPFVKLRARPSTVPECHRHRRRSRPRPPPQPVAKPPKDGCPRPGPWPEQGRRGKTPPPEQNPL